MTEKYHINSKGKPSVCRATVRGCPLESNLHYSKEEAYLVAEMENEMKHGLVGEERKSFKVATSDREKQYVAAKIKALNESNGGNNFSTRISNSEMIESYTHEGTSSIHFTSEREPRYEGIKRTVGIGEEVGTFAVVETSYEEERVFYYKVFESGFTEIYRKGATKREDRAVTRYVFNPSTIESTFLKAGVIPDPSLLENAKKNGKIEKIEYSKILEERKEEEKERKLKEKRDAIVRRREMKEKSQKTISPEEQARRDAIVERRLMREEEQRKQEIKKAAEEDYSNFNLPNLDFLSNSQSKYEEQFETQIAKKESRVKKKRKSKFSKERIQEKKSQKHRKDYRDYY